MRCLVKQGEEWAQEKPANVSDWIWQHDGKEALVIDDKKPKTYFAASYEVFDQCKAEGKNVLMFWDLEVKLREGKK